MNSSNASLTPPAGSTSPPRKRRQMQNGRSERKKKDQKRSAGRCRIGNYGGQKREQEGSALGTNRDGGPDRRLNPGSMDKEIPLLSKYEQGPRDPGNTAILFAAYPLFVQFYFEIPCFASRWSDAAMYSIITLPIGCDLSALMYNIQISHLKPASQYNYTTL